MPQAIPQRTITISLTGTGEDAQAFYTYLSPITGLSYLGAPVCDLKCSQPTFCLYVLDFASTLSGWTIIDTTPVAGSGTLSQTPGANHLSVATFNPYTTDSTYNFYINYRNTITGKTVHIDPQEGNVPR